MICSSSCICMCKNRTTVKDTLVHLISNGHIKVFQNLNALIKRKERLFLPKNKILKVTPWNLEQVLWVQRNLNNQEGVWFVFLNNHFQFLNNILCISIHFFTHMYFHKCFETTIFSTKRVIYSFYIFKVCLDRTYFTETENWKQQISENYCSTFLGGNYCSAFLFLFCFFNFLFHSFPITLFIFYFLLLSQQTLGGISRLHCVGFLYSKLGNVWKNNGK